MLSIGLVRKIFLSFSFTIVVSSAYCQIKTYCDLRTLSGSIGSVVAITDSKTGDKFCFSETDPIRPVRTSVLLENRDSSNHPKIKHVADPKYKYILWRFSNFKTVKMGGNRLSITFQGTHPGLGNGNPDTNEGSLDFIIDDGSTTELVDIRANVRDAEDFGFHIYGGTELGSGLNRVKQLNLSGLYCNAPVVTTVDALP